MRPSSFPATDPGPLSAKRKSPIPFWDEHSPADYFTVTLDVAESPLSLLVVAGGKAGGQSIYGGNAANHQYKVAFALMLFLVTTATCILRWRKPDLFEQKSTKWWYAGAYLVSFALAGILGFLGGIIVFP